MLSRLEKHCVPRVLLLGSLTDATDKSMLDEYTSGEDFRAAPSGESFAGVKDVDVLLTALRCRLLLRFHEETAAAGGDLASPCSNLTSAVTSDAELIAAAAHEYLRSAMLAADEHTLQVPLSLAVALFMSIEAFEIDESDPDRPVHPIMRAITQVV